MIKSFLKFYGIDRKPTHEEAVMSEARLLDKDILERELALIDAHFKIEAQKCKKQFLLDWLQRDTPKSVVTKEIFK